jgi:hypothetical protein
MKNKLVVEDQVVFFLQRQPPETRRRMREALHAVENGIFCGSRRRAWWRMFI